MRYEFAIFHQKRNILFLSILGIFALIYTLAYFAALADVIHTYSLTTMVFQYADEKYLPLHFWIVNQAPIFIANEPFNFLDFMFTIVIIPLVLAILHVDTFIQEKKNNLINVTITKKGKYKFYYHKLLSVFIISLLAVFLTVLFQFLIGWLCNFSGIVSFSSPALTLPDFLNVFFYGMRFSLYYAATATLALGVSLYLKRLSLLVYALPVLLTLLSAGFYPPFPYNLAFYGSNLRDTSMDNYYIFVFGCLLLAAVLTLVKAGRKDEL